MPKDKKLKVYLCGSIEASPDGGKGWRVELTPFLESLGLEVLDPCVLENDKLKNFQPNRLPDYYTDLDGKKIKVLHWHQLKNSKETHLYDRFLKYMRRIIKYDLKLVEDADYLIVYWDEKTGKGAGSHSEVTWAFMKNIPVYCVASVDIPAWGKACMQKICLTFDDLKKFLQEEFGDD